MTWMDLLGGADAWERPQPRVEARDALVAGVALGFVAVSFELARSYQDFTGHRPYWAEYLAIVLACLLLVGRRRWPLPVALLSFVLLFGCASLVPEVGYQLTFQLACFVAIHSGVAWARDRRAAVVVMAVILLAMVLWLSWSFALGQGIQQLRASGAKGHGGLLSPVPAVILFSFLINAVYLVGAIAMGQSAWREAAQRSDLAQQARTISAQSKELQERAVVDERLRIARELHDVVAHHVSVMGIQAAGARRLIERDPARAAEALEQVEASSREAVIQMRGLLGALRGSGQDAEEPREPQPTLAELPALVAGDDGLQVTSSLVENRPGELTSLPLPVQLTLYRTVQEALANVRRHSTARRANVTLRILSTGQGRFAEAEVLDEGSPRSGTSGSGLGLLGMRERITSHGGSCEIGPRLTGGYRVRVRLPVPPDDVSTSGDGRLGG